jgi:hypothetical protein
MTLQELLEQVVSKLDQVIERLDRIEENGRGGSITYLPTCAHEMTSAGYCRKCGR